MILALFLMYNFIFFDGIRNFFSITINNICSIKTATAQTFRITAISTIITAAVTADVVASRTAAIPSVNIATASATFADYIILFAAAIGCVTECVCFIPKHLFGFFKIKLPTEYTRIKSSWNTRFTKYYLIFIK